MIYLSDKMQLSGYLMNIKNYTWYKVTSIGHEHTEREYRYILKIY